MRLLKLLALSLASLVAMPVAAADAPTMKIVSQGAAVQTRTDRYVMHSARIGRDFLIEVTQPRAFGIQSADVPFAASEKFPAIYALDGGYGIAGQSVRLLSSFGTMVPAYVVAIGYPNDSGSHVGYRNVDLVHVARNDDEGKPSGNGGAKFAAFILEDLRPFLEKRYPLDPAQAVLFGHSLGGLFAASVLVDKPDAFGAYFIASPTLGVDPSIIDRAKKIASAGGGRRVFITSAPQDLQASLAIPFAAALTGPGSGFVARQMTFQGTGHGTSYFNILAPGFTFLLPPIVPAAASRKAIALEPQALNRYAGKYQLAPGAFVTVTAISNHLFAEITNQPQMEIFPQAAGEFFYKAVDAQISFASDDAGKISRLMIHQNGRDTQAMKIE